jgi:peptide/nickel transport system permease protein
MNLYLYLSDYLYLIFCVYSLWAVVQSYRNQANRQVWNKILQQETAVISASIFFFFILISILDSIHFGAVGTLLDQIFSPLNHVMEYSYSRPCSYQSFIPQLINDDLGLRQIYPHLGYVPSKFQDQSQIWSWMLHLIFQVSLYFIAGIVILGFCVKKVFFTLYRPYRLSMITIILMLWLITILFLLSRQLHIFGTGQIGQDIFYQAVKSIRTGLFISAMTTLIILPFAISLGLSAGYFGGWIDDVVQFLYTVISSIPSVLLIGASLLSWQFFQEKYFSNWSMSKQADIRIIVICLLLGLTNWASLCRYIRAEVFKLREMNYIKVARLLGSSSSFILRKHLLPNVMHMVIITVILDFSYYILAESVLTYIGIGVSPSTISWGNMINAARLELARIPAVWWPLLTAFCFMFTVVLVCNLLADAIRKALNPKEQIFTQKF